MMATPPDHWRLRSGDLPLPGFGGSPRRPIVMGIVNVTPDSFSDGGRPPVPGRGRLVVRSCQRSGGGVMPTLYLSLIHI